MHVPASSFNTLQHNKKLVDHDMTLSFQSFLLLPFTFVDLLNSVTFVDAMRLPIITERILGVDWRKLRHRRAPSTSHLTAPHLFMQGTVG